MIVGVSPDSATYAALLQKFGAENRLADGREVHRHIRDRGYDGDTFLGNLLAQMYGRCGEAALARRAFDRIRKPDLFSWNIMIQAYSQCGEIESARHIFDSMPEKNVISWNAMLSAYSRHGSIQDAEELFDRMPQRSCASWNAMLGAYAANGNLDKAGTFFLKIPCKNVVSWNSMAAALARGERKVESLEMVWAMSLEGTKASAVTMIIALEGCTDLQKGRAVHAVIEISGFDRDFKVKNALINMYGKCGDLERARELFDDLPNPSVVSWTAMVGGHAQWGDLAQAAEFFHNCPEKSVVTWNSMIAGYGRNDEPTIAIHTFKLLDLDGEAPNAVSFVCVLDACSSLGSLPETRIIHAAAIDCSLDKNTAVATALITAYGKCGSVESSLSCFQHIPRKDFVAWSALAGSYAHNGHSAATLEMFYSMVQSGMDPDGVVFVSVLAACSHGGDLALGLHCFGSMTSDYSAAPWRDHYFCLVDLFCRSGDLDRTVALIEAAELEAGVCVLQTSGILSEIHFEFATDTLSLTQTLTKKQTLRILKDENYRA